MATNLAKEQNSKRSWQRSVLFLDVLRQRGNEQGVVTADGHRAALRTRAATERAILTAATPIGWFWWGRAERASRVHRAPKSVHPEGACILCPLSRSTAICLPSSDRLSSGHVSGSASL
jgi:hypothetical protein